MALNIDARTCVIQKFRRADFDTGSTEVQVALLSANINSLTEHVKIHKKDVHSRRGLLSMVNRRRKLLNYLKHKNLHRYLSLIKKLGIRK